jgi:hypothetical protein
VKKKRRYKRIFKTFLLIGLAIGLLYWVLNAVWIQRIPLALLHKHTGWDIRAQKVRMHPFAGSVKIEHLSISSPSKRQLYAADHVFVRISPLSIIKGKIILSKLMIGDVLLAFENNDDTKIDIEKIDHKKEPKFTIKFIRHLAEQITSSIFLQIFSVDDARAGPIRILISDQAEPKTRLYLKQFSFHLSQNLWLRNEFGFDVDQFIINKSLIGKKIIFESELSAEKVNVKNLFLDREEGAYHIKLNTVTHDKAIHAEVDLQAGLTGIFKEPLQGQLSLKLVPPYLNFEKIDLQLSELVAAAKGQWNLKTGKHEATVTLNDIDWMRLHGLLQGQWIPELEGIVSVQGRMAGIFPAIKAEADVVGRDLTYQMFAAQRVVGNALLSWPQLTWQASAYTEETEHLVSQGSVQLPHDNKTTHIQSLKLDLRGLPLESTLPNQDLGGVAYGLLEFQSKANKLVGQGHLQVDQLTFKDILMDDFKSRFSVVGSQWTVSELFLDPHQYPQIKTTDNLYIDVREKAIHLYGKPLRGLDIKSHYDLTTKRFVIDALDLEIDQKKIFAKGSVNSNGTFQASMHGTLDAALLTHMRSVFNESQGIIDLELAAHGNLSDPLINGQLAFKNIGMDIRGLGDPISDLNGQLILKNKSLILKKFEGKHGDGTFGVKGSIALKGFVPDDYDLEVTCQSLTFRIPKKLQVDFNAELNLKGKSPGPRVVGKLEVIAGRYFKNFNIADIVFAEDLAYGSDNDAVSEFLRQWRWDIQVRNNGDIRIQNNVADVYLGGDIILKGTSGHPQLLGVVAANEGELHYLGHDLIITEGTIVFKGGVKIRPYLKMEAQKEIPVYQSNGSQKIYTITVNLKGPFDNLQVILDSKPPLARSDVISVLAFGMTQAQLRESGSTGGALATNLIAGSLASGFGSLGDSVGLDTIRFVTSTDTDSSSETSISGVAFGKNLSDRLSVEFFTDISPDTAERRVRSQYFLTDNISFEGRNTFRQNRTKFQFNVSLKFAVR